MIGFHLLMIYLLLTATHPILQGLNAPVNDLSRGCNEEDVFKLAIISSMEAIVHSDRRAADPNYNQFED